MTDKPIFPALTDFEPTRQTLQLYSRVVGVVPRAHCDFHPKWWHISLKVEPGGLITNPAALPQGGEFRVKMDLHQHKILLLVDGGLHNEISMTAGLTANQMADEILRDVADLGLIADYATEKYDNDNPREYNPAAAENYLTALVNADRIFKAHRAALSGEVGPVQVWPHGFDLAFEYFGTRVETYEENGEVQEHPSQLNLGFYPGNTEDAYFYSNPWPFESEILLSQSLPAGARWHTEGWQGSILPYGELVGDGNAEQRLRDYAKTVYELSAPTLTA
jgi:hypothetical protein